MLSVRYLVLMFVVSSSIGFSEPVEQYCGDDVLDGSFKSKVYFDSDFHRFSMKANPDLQQILKRVTPAKKAIKKINIIGHTDKIGSEKYNLRLSRRRAEEVAYIFLKAGLVSPSQVYTAGKGESEPAIDAVTLEANSKNRRVEVEIIFKESHSLACQEKTKVHGLAIQNDSKDRELDSENKDNRIYFELTGLASELASNKSRASVDEILSEVRVSGVVGAYFHIAQKWSIGLHVGLRHYEYSTDLASNIEEQYSDISIRAGASLVYHMFEWWDHELAVLYDQQSYFFGVPSTMNTSQQKWLFRLQEAYRFEYQSHFGLLDTKNISMILTPFLAYFGASDNIKGLPFGWGGQLAFDFYPSRLFGVFGRYWLNDFTILDGDINHENLEIGIRMNFGF